MFFLIDVSFFYSFLLITVITQWHSFNQHAREPCPLYHCFDFVAKSLSLVAVILFKQVSYHLKFCKCEKLVHFFLILKLPYHRRAKGQARTLAGNQLKG
jgi:hypothetical protein